MISRARVLRGSLALLVLTALAVGLWAFWLEPRSLAVSEHELRLPGWPEELAGTRVAVLADLHVGSPFNGRDRLVRVVDLTNAARVDLVLIAGDLVIQGVLGGRFVAPEDVAAELSRLRAPGGVWAVLGNHDWWFDGERVRAALEVRGIRVLDDESASIRLRSRRVWLVGVSDFWEGDHDVGGALEGVGGPGPVLLMTHNPDLFPQVPSAVSLVVAGHTHGGQVALPILGRPVVPSTFGERYASGHVVEGGRHLFVSAGLGTSILPVRFRVPPEISVLVLRPAGGRESGDGGLTAASESRGSPPPPP